MPIQKITPVDPFRRSQWMMPSAIRRVNLKEVQYLLPLASFDSWQQGDLILGRVEGAVGQIDRIQNVNRGSGMNYREARLIAACTASANGPQVV
jgi:hypothetical protein